MLSVIVCTYNGEQFLAQQLDTLLSQTLPPDEIVIHDDGSRDGTLRIASDYARRDDRFRIVSNEGEHGVNGNFFAALRAAKGDYIAICDQDDLWEPTKLEKQMAAMTGNSHTTTSSAMTGNSTGPLLCGCISQPFSEGGTAVKADLRMPCLSPLRMMYVGMMPGHPLLLRRELLDYLPNGNFFMYDLQIQMTAALLQRIAYVPEPLVHQRRHVSATTYCPPQSKFMQLLEPLRNYRRLRPQLRRRFAHWQCFLGNFSSRVSDKALDEDNSSSGVANTVTAEALRMARLQQSGKFLPLEFFCIRHRHELFHSDEQPALVCLLRSVLFPLTCTNYYRYLLGQPCPEDWK